METNYTFDFVRLGILGEPLNIILRRLTPSEIIRFASTNSEIRRVCFSESKHLRQIEQSGTINLNIFQERINTEIIEAIYYVFENLEKIIVRLANVENGFLDNLRKFSTLRKLSIHLVLDDDVSNRHGLNMREVTIKAEYLNTRFNRDAMYALLWQIRGVKRISIYNGHLDRRLIFLLSSRNLSILKVNNSIIPNPIHMSNMILENSNLLYLKLVSQNHLTAPFPSYAMRDFISQLPYNRNLTIDRLSYSINSDPNIILFCNLRYLKHLRDMTVYFSVQSSCDNLERLIYYAATLRRVNVKFIEFVEKFRILNRNILDTMQRESNYFKNVVESMDNFMTIVPVNFDTLRSELNFD